VALAPPSYHKRGRRSHVYLATRGLHTGTVAIVPPVHHRESDAIRCEHRRLPAVVGWRGERKGERMRELNRRCGGCNRPFTLSTPMRLIGGMVYCLACAASYENARRCD